MVDVLYNLLCEQKHLKLYLNFDIGYTHFVCFLQRLSHTKFWMVKYCTVGPTVFIWPIFMRKCAWKQYEYGSVIISIYVSVNETMIKII